MQGGGSRQPSAARLRRWQVEALTAYRAGSPRDFLVTATPGAGKTTFALALAVELLEQQVIGRVVVVAPTDHLRTQWAQAAHERGVELDPTLTNAVGPVRPGLHGYATTYAQVAQKPALHRARVEARPTLVILDEVHHAGDGLSWGEAVAEAFEPARRRLSLTGTPFRTRPDEKIPFVRYVDDTTAAGEPGVRSVADHSYGYREALADGVVRPVVFAAYTGVSRWRTSAGDVVAASLSDLSTRSVESAAWRTALDPGGQWVPHVIAAMDERLTHLRRSGMPDAAGLVLASDQDDARAYADIVHRVTGTKPVLITSDDPKASLKIEAFAQSDDRVAVCVRMISEGVDIPRAACLAWLTSYRTPLFFAQAVGRVVRARGAHESATVFLPAVRPLLVLAAELESERDHVVAVRGTLEPDGLDEVEVERVPGGGGGVDFEALEASAEFAHVLQSGRAVVASAVTEADDDYLGLPGLLTPEQTASLLASRDTHLRAKAASAAQGGLFEQAEPAEVAAEEAAWQAAGALRRELNRLVAHTSSATGTPHAVLHARLRAAVPGPPSASASVEVLERRREALRKGV